MTTSWPPQPVILEVNTWVWLEELERRHGRQLDLATVPDEVWDELVVPGVQAVWLMGVWERSPRGVAVALRDPGVVADHHQALGDFTAADVVGSPYCIRSYTVDPRLGGDGALAAARAALAARGVKLIVDYVPNHVAQDHPWVHSHPEYFIRGTQEDAAQRPREFIRLGGGVFALGRDPYFQPWQDVVQLNAFSPGLRQATADTLGRIAAQADGVRCDMAMLLLNEVFARTWGPRAGEVPGDDFWPGVIQTLRAANPHFLFLAEVYWDLEAALLWEGFDYCYDKRLHDRLAGDDTSAVRDHLGAALAYQQHMVRFLENHDEPRAAATFPQQAWRALAVVLLTLPGAVLLYEGQFDARRVRPPVALGRRPQEPAHATLRQFYERLLALGADRRIRSGAWALAGVSGWPDNDSHRSVLAWVWQEGEARWLVVVNLAAEPAQARVLMAPEGLAGSAWELLDPLQGDRFQRAGTEMAEHGLFVDLPGWGFHLLEVTAAR